MAIVDLAPAITLATTPFKTAPGGIVEDTYQPVGLTWFTGQTAIAVKSAGDETHIRWVLTFPTQYSYILKDIQLNLQLTLGVTHNFQQYGLIHVANGYSGYLGRQQGLGLKNDGISFEFGSAVAVDPVRTYELAQPFHQLLVAPEGSEMTWTFYVADENAGATNVGLFNFTACFYRFGLEQALSSALNAPQPTISY